MDEQRLQEIESDVHNAISRLSDGQRMLELVAEVRRLRAELAAHERRVEAEQESYFRK